MSRSITDLKQPFNEKGAQRSILAALEAYTAGIEQTPDSVDPSTLIAAVLADLRHYADAQDVSWDQALKNAERMYRTEIEQAGQGE